MNAVMTAKQSIFLNKIQNFYRRMGVTDERSLEAGVKKIRSQELQDELARIPYRHMDPDINHLLSAMKFLQEMGMVEFTDKSPKALRYLKEGKAKPNIFAKPPPPVKTIVLPPHRRKLRRALSTRMLSEFPATSDDTASRMDTDYMAYRDLSRGHFPIGDIKISEDLREHYHSLVMSIIKEGNWNASRLEVHAFQQLCGYMKRKASDFIHESQKSPRERTRSRTPVHLGSQDCMPDQEGIAKMTWALLEIRRIREQEDSYNVDADTGFCHNIDNLLAILMFRGREQVLQSFAMHISRVQERRLARQKLKDEGRSRQKMLTRFEKCYSFCRHDDSRRVGWVFSFLAICVVIIMMMMYASWFKTTKNMTGRGLSSIQVENLCSGGMVGFFWFRRSNTIPNLIPLFLTMPLTLTLTLTPTLFKPKP